MHVSRIRVGHAEANQILPAPPAPAALYGLSASTGPLLSAAGIFTACAPGLLSRTYLPSALGDCGGGDFFGGLLEGQSLSRG